MMKLVVTHDALIRAASSGAPSVVYGHYRSGEGLVQILDAAARDGLEPVGVVRPLAAVSGARVRFDLDGSEVELALAESIPEPTETVLMYVTSELDSRRADLVHGLDGKRVALFGAGSVGSAVGLQLAQAGVGTFDVVDDDTFEAANLSRHVCGPDDLGRFKATSVAERLAGCRVSASPIQRDIASFDEGDLDALVESSDLVVATTDSAAAQFFVNESCVRTRTPGVFVGCYERAVASEVILARPGGACLFCAVGFRAHLGLGLMPTERPRVYQAADSEQLTAEPGLAVDIAYTSSIASAYSLAMLGCRPDLLDESTFMILIHAGHQPSGAREGLFRVPFEVVHARPTRSDPCPVCGWIDSKRPEGRVT
jgi:hypothetical protein